MEGGDLKLIPSRCTFLRSAQSPLDQVWDTHTQVCFGRPFQLRFKVLRVSNSIPNPVHAPAWGECAVYQALPSMPSSLVSTLESQISFL